jgi:TPR repeat protein
MKPVSSGFMLLAVSTALACVVASPAAAQFYRLDGRFQCLERQGAVCYDAATPPPEPEARREAADHPPATVDHTLDDLTALLASVATEPSARPPAPADPLRAIATRIAARTPSPGDVSTLEADAKAGDVRAIELLAWCAYAGVGGRPDPIRAYFLYGQAAAAGAAGMAHNQAVVYATMLTSEQRQQIAEIENGQ